jgi:hypothetical protein
MERRTTKRQVVETTKGAQAAVRLLGARGSRYDSTVASGKGYSYVITNVIVEMSGPSADSFVASCFRGRLGPIDDIAARAPEAGFADFLRSEIERLRHGR